MRGPPTSVIVPAYNGERFVAEAIESIVAQTFGPIELIVVDDGSSDRTAEIARCYPEATVLTQANGGPGAARNTGIEASSGEILAFHDQDDVMLPRKLEIQVSHLLEHPDVDVTLGDQEVFIEDGATLPDWDRIVAPDLFEGEAAQTTIVGSISMVAWRRAFDRVGNFDSSIFGGDDLDWMFRASEAGLNVQRLDVPVVRRRVHRDNISQNTDACRRALTQCFMNRIRRRRATA